MAEEEKAEGEVAEKNDAAAEGPAKAPEKIEAIIETFNGFGEDRLGIKGYRAGRVRPAKHPPEIKNKRGDDTI